MNLDEILTLGLTAAKHLGIHVQYPQLVLEKMKPLVSVTSIFYNEDWMLWIDRHYIAFSKLNSPDVVYVMADKIHVSEELRSLKSMLATEESDFHAHTLRSIISQLDAARSVIKETGNECYTYPIAKTFKPYHKKITPASSKQFILTLCGTCRRDCDDVYNVRRADNSQYIKERCCRCNKYGYDYELTPKRRKEAAR